MNDGTSKFVGTVFGERWRLVRRLGEGGMGAVFEAEDLRGGERRALKLLHDEFVADRSVVERFLREAHASQKLAHENIVRIFHSGMGDGGRPYLVMELLQGKSLGQTILETGAMPELHAALVAHGVLDALALVHAAGIVHRDLKPENVFLTRSAGGRFVVKILDFGIAKVKDIAGGLLSVTTTTGATLGTIGYMSPEQLRDSKSVDVRTDLWSVGVMLYEMLTGLNPFPISNSLTWIATVLAADGEELAARLPVGLATWDPVVRRALQRRPEDRFQTAAEMAAQIRSLARAMRAP